MFADSHCHLHLAHEYKGALPSEQMVINAKKSGVNVMLSVCTIHKEFAEIQQFAQKHEGVYCTYGVHPHHAGEEMPLEELEKEIRKAVQQSKVVALGEAGLDYFYEHSPRDIQKEVFRLHLKMAQELNVPLVIHSRNAEEDTIEILEEAFARGPLRGVIHCFTSKKILADYAVEKGLYIGATGVITFKKSQDLRDIFAKVPDNLLLIETDAPYLAPVPHRGKANEPAFVVHVAECLAEIRGQSLEYIAKKTTDNFYNLFDIV